VDIIGDMVLFFDSVYGLDSRLNGIVGLIVNNEVVKCMSYFVRWIKNLYYKIAL
jgi:hypothetical protein